VLSVTGNIVTDGATGVLSDSDIRDWDLFLTAGDNTVELTGPLSGNDSYFNIYGTDFTATSTGLFFNFSDVSTDRVYTATPSGSAALGFMALKRPSVPLPASPFTQALLKRSCVVPDRRPFAGLLPPVERRWERGTLR
jgi:hypothetical protein